jgi:hypothetical protein
MMTDKTMASSATAVGVAAAAASKRQLVRTCVVHPKAFCRVRDVKLQHHLAVGALLIKLPLMGS